MKVEIEMERRSQCGSSKKLKSLEHVLQEVEE